MQILVTGGAGFIGSSLVDFLLLKDYSIICLDNFDDYYSQQIKRANLKGALINPNFNLIVGDIRNENLLNDIFLNNKIDLVIHLAAKVGVHHSVLFPDEYFDVNVNGTQCLLNAMQSNTCKNLIFASSSSVYGERNGAFSENDPTENQISPYALSKKRCEVLINDFANKNGLSAVNLRFFSVYGERQRPDLIIHKIFNTIQNGQFIEIYGDGSTTRDYTHINDVLLGIWKAIEYCLQIRSTFEIFNIGNSNPVSIHQLLTLIKELTGQELKVSNLPFQSGDVISTCANINKAKTILNFNPKIFINEGLERFYKWFNDES